MEFYTDLGSSDPLRPSLFELIAQEQLRDLLQPALKYVLAVFAQRYPRYLLRIVNRHEEFYAAIMLLVERHYLRKHNASFAENFYGLKRRRFPWISTERMQAAVGGIPAGDKLRQKELVRSLLVLVGIPYLRAKTQDYYEELGGGVDPDVNPDDGRDIHRLRALTDQSITGRMKRGFKAVYPWLNTSFEIWLLVCNIAYLFDQTPFYRPWLRWIGVDLRRLGAEDFRQDARLASTPDTTPKSPLTRLRQLLLTSPQLLLDSLRLLLPTSIFFVKFLEWWYSPNSPARSLTSSTTLGPAVPPPKLLPPHPKGILVGRTSYGVCPLCRREGIVNATALPSGYVFCYRCAYDHVEKHGKCPVTLIPARVWQLRKVLI